MSRRIGREWRHTASGERYLAMTPQEFGGIYQIVNHKTGSIYIGASGSITQRYQSHLQSLGRGVHPNASLQREFNEHGLAGYALEVLQLAPANARHSLEAEAISQAVLGGALMHNACGVATAARRLLEKRGAPECWPPAGTWTRFSKIQANSHARSCMRDLQMRGEANEPLPPKHVMKVFREVYRGDFFPNAPLLYADTAVDLGRAGRLKRARKAS